MCFDSGGDEADKQAQQARADEAARQERIRQGTARIAAIFEGGTIPGAQITTNTTYDPNATYYDASGNVFKPQAIPSTTTSYGGTTATGATPGKTNAAASPVGVHESMQTASGIPNSSLGAGAPAGSRDAIRAVSQGGGAVTRTTPGKTAQQAFLDALKAGNVYSSKASSQTGTFTPAYYDKLKQSYIDYATPQLTDQYDEAKKQLVYSLARSGTLDSSMRGQKEAEAGKVYTTNQQGILDKANEYVGTTKSNVEDARNQLIATLNATGDTQGAATGAIARAAALSTPPAFNPLTNLFSDFTAGLGTQAALERASALSGQNVSKYNTGLFTPGRVSVS